MCPLTPIIISTKGEHFSRIFEKKPAATEKRSKVWVRPAPFSVDEIRMKGISFINIQCITVFFFSGILEPSLTFCYTLLTWCRDANMNVIFLTSTENLLPGQHRGQLHVLFLLALSTVHSWPSFRTRVLPVLIEPRMLAINQSGSS